MASQRPHPFLCIAVHFAAAIGHGIHCLSCSFEIMEELKAMKKAISSTLEELGEKDEVVALDIMASVSTVEGMVLNAESAGRRANNALWIGRFWENVRNSLLLLVNTMVVEPLQEELKKRSAEAAVVNLTDRLDQLAVDSPDRPFISMPGGDSEQPTIFLYPISKEDRAFVREKLRTKGSDMAIVRDEDGNDTMQRGSYDSIDPKKWYDDNVINCYLRLLQKRDIQTHCFNTGFMLQLFSVDPTKDDDQKFCYGKVETWSNKVRGKDIFQLKKIFFPMNLEHKKKHWTLAVVFMEEKRIEYFDSLHGSGKKYIDALWLYLQVEHMVKRKCAMESQKDWTIVYRNPGIPQQQNDYDCGPFICLYADCISRDRSPDQLRGYTEKTTWADEIQAYRKWMTLSILKGTIA